MKPHDRAGVTRRSFLGALGAAAGGGVLLGAIEALGLGSDSGAADRFPFRGLMQADFGLQGRTNDASVVVLGAGVSGLCCAYELGKAGYDVTVLEASDRYGGRNWTARARTVHTDTTGATQRCHFGPGRWLNTGPARIAQHHTTLDYCRELGVPVEVFVNANIDAYIERDGVVRRRRSAMADLDGYVSELLAKSISADVLDDELSTLEAGALIDYLRAVGTLGRSNRGYTIAPGITSGKVGEPDPLALLLDLGVGERLAFEHDWHQAMPMFHPVGGMDRIIVALIDAIGIDRIHLNAAATRIDESETGVRVTTAGQVGQVEADWGICCVQPGPAAAIANPWNGTIRQALAQAAPVATGKIGLEYNERFWETEDRILGGASATHADVRVIWYPSTRYLSDGGVIVGAYPFGSSAAAFGRMTHDDREALAVGRGKTLHGEQYANALVSSFSVDWSSVPHMQGAWTTGLNSSSLETLRMPTGRWHFAGDWMSRTPGWQHGAFESARQAVTSLHKRQLNEG